MGSPGMGSYLPNFGIPEPGPYEATRLRRMSQPRQPLFASLTTQEAGNISPWVGVVGMLSETISGFKKSANDAYLDRQADNEKAMLLRMEHLKARLADENLTPLGRQKMAEIASEESAALLAEAAKGTKDGGKLAKIFYTIAGAERKPGKIDPLQAMVKMDRFLEAHPEFYTKTHIEKANEAQADVIGRWRQENPGAYLSQPILEKLLAPIASTLRNEVGKDRAMEWYATGLAGSMTEVERNAEEKARSQAQARQKFMQMFSGGMTPAPPQPTSGGTPLQQMLGGIPPEQLPPVPYRIPPQQQAPLWTPSPMAQAVSQRVPEAAAILQQPPPAAAPQPAQPVRPADGKGEEIAYDPRFGPDTLGPQAFSYLAGEGLIRNERAQMIVPENGGKVVMGYFVANPDVPQMSGWWNENGKIATKMRTALDRDLAGASGAPERGRVFVDREGKFGEPGTPYNSVWDPVSKTDVPLQVTLPDGRKIYSIAVESALPWQDAQGQMHYGWRGAVTAGGKEPPPPPEARSDVQKSRMHAVWAAEKLNADNRYQANLTSALQWQQQMEDDINRRGVTGIRSLLTPEQAQVLPDNPEAAKAQIRKWAQERVKRYHIAYGAELDSINSLYDPDTPHPSYQRQFEEKYGVRPQTTGQPSGDIQSRINKFNKGK